MKTVKEYMDHHKQTGNFLSSELKEVKPLPQPSGTLHFLDFIYNPKPKIYIYPDGTIIIKKRNYKFKRIIL